jgi:hypothetical protein
MVSVELLCTLRDLSTCSVGMVEERGKKPGRDPGTYIVKKKGDEKGR